LFRVLAPPRHKKTPSYDIGKRNDSFGQVVLVQNLDLFLILFSTTHQILQFSKEVFFKLRLSIISSKLGDLLIMAIIDNNQLKQSHLQNQLSDLQLELEPESLQMELERSIKIALFSTQTLGKRVIDISLVFVMVMVMN